MGGGMHKARVVMQGLSSAVETVLSHFHLLVTRWGYCIHVANIQCNFVS